MGTHSPILHCPLVPLFLSSMEMQLLPFYLQICTKSPSKSWEQRGGAQCGDAAQHSDTHPLSQVMSSDLEI